MMPPTITIPNGIRLVAAAPKDKAIGKAPKDIAKLVIKMGRIRALAASMMASLFGMPALRF